MTNLVQMAQLYQNQNWKKGVACTTEIRVISAICWRLKLYCKPWWTILFQSKKVKMSSEVQCRNHHNHIISSTVKTTHKKHYDKVIQRSQTLERSSNVSFRSDWKPHLDSNHQVLPICQSKNITFWARALHLIFLDWQNYGGSTSKSQLVANSKLDGGSIMIFWNDPKSCTPTMLVIGIILLKN